jgi:hypothetical protein
LEKVKEKYQQKLTDDFKRYTKQMGIMTNDMPQLVTDRKTMEQIRDTWPDKSNHRSSTRSYGICYREKNVIFVNSKSRLADYKRYKGAKYSQHYLSKHKMVYRDYLRTLIHELVHYRFDYLQHGAKFEQRIREILAGRVFPEKGLFDNDTSQPSDKNVTSTPILIEPVDFTPILTPTPTETIDYESKYRELLERYNKLDLDWMRQS